MEIERVVQFWNEIYDVELKLKLFNAVRSTKTYRYKNHTRRHNIANCIKINVEPPANRRGSSSTFVPSLYLSNVNVMSLAPKIDEIRYFASEAKVDLICITETWLKSHIDDNIINIGGYSLVRRDRIGVDHGGICTYIKTNINFTFLEDLQNPNYEVLWLKLRQVLMTGIYCNIFIHAFHRSNLVSLTAESC